VYAIIVSKPENGELSPASVSYTAGAVLNMDDFIIHYSRQTDTSDLVFV
jgi:hypothetical protein